MDVKRGDIIIIIYSSIALISSSVRTCSVRCLEIACVQEHENNIHNSNRHNKTMIINTETYYTNRKPMVNMLTNLVQSLGK